MRLLKFGSDGGLSLTRDLIEDIPPYAILSHTWGADDDEVTFDDIKDGSPKNKAGYAKIFFCGEQAQRDGLQYFWVDTCNINKANHSELSEAIASMFRWYRDAVKCYVYLSDVVAHNGNNIQTQRTWEPEFRKSKWFRRGWTLQELIAPASVEFFSREGEWLGNKTTLEQQIYEITGIPIEVLRGTTPLSDFSVDERMQWASNRNTKRKEDKAYCLMGIFNVFIPLIYGEEENAYKRLLREIDESVRRDTLIPLASIRSGNQGYNKILDEDIPFLQRFQDQGGLPRLLRLLQVNLPPQLPFHYVMVIDARGQPLPLPLQTITSKELFIHVLKCRFKDLGCGKIDRAEWFLEDAETKEVLDLSKPWQSLMRPDRVLNMSMIFRRRNVMSTQCPSCKFMNPSLPDEEVKCQMCGLMYRRIEEIQDIVVREEDSLTRLKTNPSANPDVPQVVSNLPPPLPRPRPPKRRHSDEDMRYYKRVQVVNTNFQIHKAGKSNTVPDRNSLTVQDLQDPERLAAYLADLYGLPEEECLTILEESETQLTAIRAEFQEAVLDDVARDVQDTEKRVTGSDRSTRPLDKYLEDAARLLDFSNLRKDRDDAYPEPWKHIEEPFIQLPKGHSDANPLAVAVDLPRQATFRRRNSELLDRSDPLVIGHVERHAQPKGRERHAQVELWEPPVPLGLPEVWEHRYRLRQKEIDAQLSQQDAWFIQQEPHAQVGLWKEIRLRREKIYAQLAQLGLKQRKTRAQLERGKRHAQLERRAQNDRRANSPSGLFFPDVPSWADEEMEALTIRA